MARYRVSGNERLLTHGKYLSKLLRDISDHPRSKEIEALVASGDCFITLATELDNISELLDNSTIHSNAKIEIEKLTSTLIYLQQHYKVDRKTSDYRQ